MAVAVLSPWPTTPAALRDATACLKAAIGEDDDANAQRLGATAAALVERYAPDAPQLVRNEAVIRAAGWLREQPAAAVRSEGIGEVSTSYATTHVSALRHSGAMALLSPFKQRRAGAIGGRAAASAPTPSPAPAPAPKPEPSPMPMPTVRFFRVELVIGTSGLPQVQGWTAQEWISNASAEVPGATVRAVSMAAPVRCYHEAFHYPQGATQYEWACIAVAHGDDPPTHYRLADGVQPDNWPQRWTQASGQAVIAGGVFDVFYWPVVVAAFPATLRFEWPLA